MLRTIFVFCGVVFSYLSNAQQAGGGFVLYGLSVGHHSLIDNAISPVKYIGISGGGVFGYHYSSNSTMISAQLYVSGGFYNHNEFPSFKYREINLYYARLESSYARYISQWKGIKWFLGGAINAFGNLNEKIGYTNSRYNHSIVLNISLDNIFLRDFKWLDIPFQIEFKVKVPLIGIVTRPYYSTNFMAGDVLGSKKIEFMGNYFHWSTDLGWYYTLSNGNRVGISYQWSYWSYNGQNVIQQARHGLFFRLCYSL